MPCAIRYILLVAVASAVVFSPSSARADAELDWLPVDRSVSDLDLRASSSRRVEQGIGVYGQSGSLYRRADQNPWSFPTGQALTQQYQLREPGVTAWIDRPDYLVRDPLGELRLNVAPSLDGQFIDLVPPNTVFDLVPYTPRASVSYDDRSGRGWENPRIDTRLNTRIGEPIGGWAQPGHDTLPAFPSPPRAHRLPAHRQAQRAEERADPQTQADDSGPGRVDEADAGE
jgi:hypothetical protein